MKDLATLNEQSYWDIQLNDKGNGEYDITIKRTNGTMPYTRTWGVEVMDEIIEESLPVIFGFSMTKYSGSFTSDRNVPGEWDYVVTVGRYCNDDEIAWVEEITLTDPYGKSIETSVLDFKEDYAYWYDMSHVSKPNLAAVGSATYGSFSGNFMFLFADSHIQMLLSSENYDNEWAADGVWPGGDREYDIWGDDGNLW